MNTFFIKNSSWRHNINQFSLFLLLNYTLLFLPFNLRFIGQCPKLIFFPFQQMNLKSAKATEDSIQLQLPRAINAALPTVITTLADFKAINNIVRVLSKTLTLEISNMKIEEENESRCRKRNPKMRVIKSYRKPSENRFFQTNCVQTNCAELLILLLPKLINVSTYSVYWPEQPSRIKT